MEQNELEQLLQSAYIEECVPEDVNIRLKNQLARKQAMGESRVSLWWLPAATGTVVSAALGLLMVLGYVIINIHGKSFLMPNLLHLVSEFWLKLHLAGIATEVIVSWIVTIIGVWKGNLVRGARIF